MARAMRIWAIALLATALLIVSGCGGSSSSDSPSASAPANSTPDTTASTGVGSLGAAAFCKEADQLLNGLDAQLAPVLDPSAVPADVEKTLKAIEDAYATVIAMAPAEIKADLQLMSSSVTQLTEAYAQANFNPAEALAAVIPLLNSQEITEAAQRIGAWGAANCTNVG